MEENNITTGRAEKANPLNDASERIRFLALRSWSIKQNSLTVLKILSIKLTLEINMQKSFEEAPEKLISNLYFFYLMRTDKL